MFGFAEQIYRTNNHGEERENENRILVATREASRAWTGRIMTLSSAIIAFSVSIVSIESLQSSLNIEQIKLSWMIFLGALILGAFNLLFESRIAYASTWVAKTSELKSTPSVSKVDKAIAIFLLIIIFIYPVFSFTSERVDLSKAYILVENWFHKLFGLVFIFEVVIFVLFILGLWFFLNAFQI